MPPEPASNFQVPWRERLLGSFVHTPESLRLLWQCSPKGAIALFALMLLSAGLPVAVAWIGKLIVDAILAAQAAIPGADRDLAVRTLVGWVGVELVLVAIQSLLDRLTALTQQLTGVRLGHLIQLKILAKALALDLSHFEDPAYYDKLTRARREASSRPLSLVMGSLQMVRQALTLFAYGTVLFGFSPWAAVGLVCAALPSFFAEARFSNATFRLQNRRSPEARKLSYLEHVLTNDSHVKEVKVFQLGPTLLERYRRLTAHFLGEDRALALRRAGWTFGFSLLSIHAFYACYLLIALAAATGRISLGEMTFYLVAFRQGQGGIQAMLGSISRMYEDNLYMANLFTFLALPTHAGPVVAVLPSRVGPRGGVQFDRVGFRYPGTEAWALRDFTLTIPAGRSIALVGGNGAGKSTVIKLLTRLYTPTEGQILLDGRDLRDWPEAELRLRLGVIFQDFNRYQFTLRENIAVGSIEQLGNEGQIRRAAKAGGVSDLIAAMPHGLDTQLGHWFSEGIEYSGGEWQKVALARAFMRESADILILDEPAAALDAEAEHAIFERFRALSIGRTTVLISHRFASVRSADLIVVLDHGRLVEQGTHDTLLAASGRYAKLFTLQARGYQ